MLEGLKFEFPYFNIVVIIGIILFIISVIVSILSPSKTKSKRSRSNVYYPTGEEKRSRYYYQKAKASKKQTSRFPNTQYNFNSNKKKRFK